MDSTPPDPSQKRSFQRIRDLSLIAPVFGLVLLIPPIIGLFATEGTVFGAPLILVYLFAVWLGLIVTAALISRSLRRDEDGRRKTP